MSLDYRKPMSNGKPITPKAPVRSKSSPYITPRLANTTGLTPSPELRRNVQIAGSGIAPRVGNSSNITPPLKTILTTNITPRSSSRKSRAGSTNSTPNSTPNGTPIHSRPVSVAVPLENLQGLEGKSGVNTISLGNSERVLSSDTNSARNPRPAETKRLGADDTTSSMFFHASDVTSLPKKPSVSSKGGTGFVYADGRQEDSDIKRSMPARSRPTSQVGMQPKFYNTKGHANGSSMTNTSSSNDSSTTSPILATPVISPRFDQRRQRSTSPLKEFEVPEQSLPSTRRTSSTSNMSTQSIAKSIVTTQSVIPASSTKYTNNRTHVKTQSMSLLEACMRPKSTPSQSDPLLSAVNSLASPHETLPPSGFFDVRASPSASTSTPTSPLTGPTYTGLSAGEHKLDQLNAMAANARRERKVLDLEISNSSLLAINRTLEKEMRKQKAELRRYRRLTSGGRLSIGPTGRSVSGATTISTVSTLSIDSDRSFDSDQETILTDALSEGESEASDDSSPSLPPEAQAAQALRQRQRDEKRLQVDLSRHRQILIDSQKLNESLKRCLGWTDELILEGKKALEYQVHVSEVAMGGRVLHEDDNPEMGSASPRLGLLSPTDVYLEDTDESLSTSRMSPDGTVDHG